MSAVSATAFTALRVRIAASRLARSRVSGQGLGTTKSLLSSPAVRTHATLASPTAASMNVFPHPRLLSQLSRLAQSARVPVPRAAPSDDTGDASSGSTETSSDQTTDTTTDTIPVSFSADEEAFGQASGEGNCEDYDVVTDKVDLNKVNNIVADAAQATGQPGWFSKPEISKNPNEKDPSAYVGGDVGYSKFYPPEARGYKYKRRVMVAVDGSVESEAAVRWAIQHICRSGDLLHIVHCAISIDPRLATFYGPLGDQISISGDGNPYSKKKYQIANDAFVAYPDEIHKRPMYDDSWAPQHLKQIRAEYFSAAVLRTEAMLDDVYKTLQEDHGKTFLVSLSSRDYFITLLDKTYKTTNLPTGVRGFCWGSLAGELADGGVDMTPFPQPIELDAILETNWEPIADMVKRRATEVDAEMLIVAHHSKKWWEEALVGSVTKYLVDHSDLNVVVVH